MQASRIASSITTPTRFKPGTVSMSSCSRLIVSSLFIVVTPVTRVPGRASDLTNFELDRVHDGGDHDRRILVAYQAAVAIGVAGAKYTSTLAPRRVRWPPA